MVQDIRVKKYACRNCGYPFDAYSPDDLFTYAMLIPCDICNILSLGKYIDQNYECENCDHKNTLYWHEAVEHAQEVVDRAISQKGDYVLHGDRVGKKNGSVL